MSRNVLVNGKTCNFPATVKQAASEIIEEAAAAKDCTALETLMKIAGESPAMKAKLLREQAVTLPECCFFPEPPTKAKKKPAAAPKQAAKQAAAA